MKSKYIFTELSRQNIWLHEHYVSCVTIMKANCYMQLYRIPIFIQRNNTKLAKWDYRLFAAIEVGITSVMCVRVNESHISYSFLKDVTRAPRCTFMSHSYPCVTYVSGSIILKARCQCDLAISLWFLDKSKLCLFDFVYIR